MQGGHYWGCATMPHCQLPSPADWGWTWPEQWMPLWTKLQEGGASCPGVQIANVQYTGILKYTVYCTCRTNCDNVSSQSRNTE